MTVWISPMICPSLLRPSTTLSSVVTQAAKYSSFSITRKHSFTSSSMSDLPSSLSTFPSCNAVMLADNSSLAALIASRISVLSFWHWLIISCNLVLIGAGIPLPHSMEPSSWIPNKKWSSVSTIALINSGDSISRKGRANWETTLSFESPNSWAMFSLLSFLFASSSIAPCAVTESRPLSVFSYVTAVAWLAPPLAEIPLIASSI